MTHPVARTIFSQLGGNRFAFMTGAKDFTSSSNALSFRLPRNAKRVTYVQIELDHNDTYTMRFYRAGARASQLQELPKVEDVYSDMLLDVFENRTGIYATLSARRA